MGLPVNCGAGAGEALGPVVPPEGLAVAPRIVPAVVPSGTVRFGVFTFMLLNPLFPEAELTVGLLLAPLLAELELGWLEGGGEG